MAQKRKKFRLPSGVRKYQPYLPDEELEIVRLYKIGMPYEEIANRMGRTKGAIATHIGGMRSAYKKLRLIKKFKGIEILRSRKKKTTEGENK